MSDFHRRLRGAKFNMATVVWFDLWIRFRFSRRMARFLDPVRPSRWKIGVWVRSSSFLATGFGLGRSTDDMVSCHIVHRPSCMCARWLRSVQTAVLQGWCQWRELRRAAPIHLGRYRARRGVPWPTTIAFPSPNCTLTLD
jgi:hypothetical protein